MANKTTKSAHVSVVSNERLQVAVVHVRQHNERQVTTVVHNHSTQHENVGVSEVLHLYGLV
jgi:hypothetical protein